MEPSPLNSTIVDLLGTNAEFVYYLADGCKLSDHEGLADAFLSCSSYSGSLMSATLDLLQLRFASLREQPRQILESESFINRVISVYYEEGINFLKAVLSDALESIYTHPHNSFEIDPERMPSLSVLAIASVPVDMLNEIRQEQVNSLKTHCGMILDRMRDPGVVDLLPKPIRVISRYIKTLSSNYPAPMNYSILGAFLVQRFLVAAILNPEEKCVYKPPMQPNGIIRRNLVLLSKVIQTIFCSGLSEIETVLLPIQDFIVSNQENVEEIVTLVTSIAMDEETSRLFNKIPEEDLGMYAMRVSDIIFANKDSLKIIFREFPAYMAVVQDVCLSQEQYIFVSGNSPRSTVTSISTDVERSDYEVLLRKGYREDFADLDSLGFLVLSGKDKFGRPLVIIHGRLFPSRDIDYERLLMYIVYRMDAVTSKHYTIIFFQSGATASNRPHFQWMTRVYRFLGRKYKKNLKNLYVIHPTMWTKVVVSLFLPLVSPKFWKKVKYLPRATHLYSFIDPSQLSIPPYALTQDEQRPQASSPSASTRTSSSYQSQVFGRPIGFSIDATTPTVPDIVLKTTDFITLHGMRTEGIFRINGSTAEMRAWQTKFDRGESVTFPSNTDPHTIAGLLKNYLSTLPEPLLTIQLHHEFVGAIQIRDSTEQTTTLADLVQRLPILHRHTLKHLLRFWHEIVSNEMHNRMNLSALSMCLAPSILGSAQQGVEFLQVVGRTAGVIAHLIRLAPILCPDQ